MNEPPGRQLWPVRVVAGAVAAVAIVAGGLAVFLSAGPEHEPEPPTPLPPIMVPLSTTRWLDGAN
ncbi:hypothetical protein JK358_31005 [Nocardia sp. 2]|uniref:Uncharacterized protein n=1 Tax=Nocardia acididurans TaxID=2802282 RepID=A0ABS1MDV7_9NOCA|nr:hypothetical protein [Nocardia acididurans]MBL1078841.1 hypothetical protein [Nocardia acididurans]